jgi:hypothetical protein
VSLLSYYILDIILRGFYLSITLSFDNVETILFLPSRPAQHQGIALKVLYLWRAGCPRERISGRARSKRLIRATAKDTAMLDEPECFDQISSAEPQPNLHFGPTASRLDDDSGRETFKPQPAVAVPIIGRWPSKPPIWHDRRDALPSDGRQHAISTGEAGTHLVASRLLSWRMMTSFAAAGAAYDLICDAPGSGLIRIQVKTCGNRRGDRFTFSMTRGFHGSAKGIFDYADSDYDVAAFVCLPLSRIIFQAGPIKRFSANGVTFLTHGIEQHSWLIALHTYKTQSANRGRN